MNLVKKVALINLIILLIYSIAFRFVARGSEKQIAILILSALTISLQVAINLIVSIIGYVSREEKIGSAFLISTGLVLVIGFSVCLANGNI